MMSSGGRGLLWVSCLAVLWAGPALGLHVQPTTRITSLAQPRSFARRVPLAPLSVSDGADPEPDDAIPAPEVTSTRESAEEAWAKAPEGTFLSPALLFAVFLTGLTIRVVVFGT